MAIIPDTLSGALLLSVFDFVACFFVLYFISFFIRGLNNICNKLEAADKSQDSSH